jgi:hypothetical protein
MLASIYITTCISLKYNHMYTKRHIYHHIYLNIITLCINNVIYITTCLHNVMKYNRIYKYRHIYNCMFPFGHKLLSEVRTHCIIFHVRLSTSGNKLYINDHSVIFINKYYHLDINYHNINS